MAGGEVMRTLVVAMLAAGSLAAQNVDQILDLEKKVAQEPGNSYNREQLIRLYNNISYNQSAPLSADRIRAGRREHILWLIEHQSAAFVLGQTDSRIEPKGGPYGDPEGYKEAARLWKEQAAKPDARVETRAHAALFFAISDRATAHSLIDPLWKAYARDPLVARVRATINAYEMLGVIPGGSMNNLARDADFAKSKRAEQARAELEGSDLPALLGNTAQIVVQVAPREALADDAERWLKRAIQIEPTNQQWSIALPRLYWTRAMNQDPSEKVRWLREAVAISTAEAMRADYLWQLATAEVDAGQLDAAEKDARAALKVLTYGWTSWNAINRAHTVLGRVALQRGKTTEAREHLLDSARLPSDAKNFGPDMQLAQALLDAGERDVVSQYLEMCRPFWNATMIDRYVASVKNDAMPQLQGRPMPRLHLALGGKLPDFKLKDLDGKDWTPAGLEGKVVAIDFWATWCGPCRDEMPALSKAAKKAAERGAVLISIDANEKEDVVRRFVSMNPVAFPVLLADDKTIRSFELDGYPTMIVLDKTGRIAYNRTSVMTEESLLAAIEEGFKGAPVLKKLPAPELLTPAADSVFDVFPRRTSVTWKPVDGAASYILEWDFLSANTWNSERPEGVMARVPSRSAWAAFDFVGAQPGRVRVTAIGSDGSPGDASPWREFRYTR
jgi:thiol-disulfide isomerase/thioredoxin